MIQTIERRSILHPMNLKAVLCPVPSTEQQVHHQLVTIDLAIDAELAPSITATPVGRVPREDQSEHQLAMRPSVPAGSAFVAIAQGSFFRSA